ncbi:integrase [Prescottella agglutinans]|uniref:Integrase n=1 Tax=Prescottella agglutinans TaxID=1644129 RepID=A0ABT6MFU9_9NOCA|nr:integrase [Prescottella agglutinans]
MAGRPGLEIGQIGAIKRTKMPDGRWRANARYKGADGVVRRVQKFTPPNTKDPRGVRAEEALVAEVKLLVGDVSDGEISGGTKLSVLCERYVAELPKSGKSARTIDTYTRDVGILVPRLGEFRVREATAQRLGRILDEIAGKHGATTAKRCRTVLAAVLATAVKEGAVGRNPVRDVELTRRTKKAKEATRALTAEELALLIHRLRTSEEPLPVERRAKKAHTTTTVSRWAEAVDLTDVIITLAGTGLRRSEVLGLKWTDLDLDAGTLTVSGHVVRAKGRGLIRESEAKTVSSLRTIALPRFVIEALRARQEDAEKMAASVSADVIFASRIGTLRDPDNLNGQWRRIRDVLGFDWVSTHDFRRSVATRLDEAGLSPRIGADVLGHAKVSMTSDVYMARSRVHKIAADALALPRVAESVE